MTSWILELPCSVVVMCFLFPLFNGSVYSNFPALVSNFMLGREAAITCLISSHVFRLRMILKEMNLENNTRRASCALGPD